MRPVLVPEEPVAAGGRGLAGAHVPEDLVEPEACVEDAWPWDIRTRQALGPVEVRQVLASARLADKVPAGVPAWPVLAGPRAGGKEGPGVLRSAHALLLEWWVSGP